MAWSSTSSIFTFAALRQWGIKARSDSLAIQNNLAVRQLPACVRARHVSHYLLLSVHNRRYHSALPQWLRTDYETQ
jgi:hypothetical protein